MGAHTDPSTLFSHRPGFSSLREAQAIWRVLNGEDAGTVSADLDVSLDVLLPWIQESRQSSPVPQTGRVALLPSDPFGADGQTVFPPL